MTRALLDTSVILGPAVDLPDDELAISTVTLAELQFGVLVATDPGIRARRLAKLADVAALFEPLPFDAVVAQHYGRMAAAVHAHGRRPRARAFDLAIAATAASHGARLYTRNGDDFQGLDDLVEVVAFN